MLEAMPEATLLLAREAEAWTIWNRSLLSQSGVEVSEGAVEVLLPLRVLKIGRAHV